VKTNNSQTFHGVAGRSGPRRTAIWLVTLLVLTRALWAQAGGNSENGSGTEKVGTNHLTGTPPLVGNPILLPDDRILRLISAGVDPVYERMLEMTTNGWLGSDVGESIVLSDQKTLWLFGDTFIGSLSNGVRVAGPPMINSTIGIQDRTRPASGCMTYYWKELGGKPASFFPHQPNTPGTYYWVTKGVMLQSELFLFAFCISNVESGTGVFDWKEAGSALIRVPNPLDPPDRWIQQAYPIKLEMGDDFQSALVVDPPYLYLYGIVQPRRMALARIQIDDLMKGRLAEAYEYWVDGLRGPHWGKDPKHCVPQFLPVNSECSVHYEPAWDCFTCFTYDVIHPEIYLTTAKHLTGPWTKPVPVCRVPEHDAVSFPIISYAVRQHPELSTRPGEVVLTYATNVPEVEQLFTAEGRNIYVPRFLRLELELDRSSKTNRPDILEPSPR